MDCYKKCLLLHEPVEIEVQCKEIRVQKCDIESSCCSIILNSVLWYVSFTRMFFVSPTWYTLPYLHVCAMLLCMYAATGPPPTCFVQSDNEYKLDLENNKYKLDSGTVEIEATYSSITSMKIIQYAFGGGDV